MRVFASFILLLVLAGLAIAGAAWWETGYFVQPGPAPAETILVITPGSGLNAIAAALGQSGVIDSTLLFRAGIMRRGRTAQLKAGEYAFPAHASEAQVMDMLVTRKILEHRITIAEGICFSVSAMVFLSAAIRSASALPSGQKRPR